jgi:hypothetical protein
MKPEFWQKKWAIFRHGNALYTLSISSINVEKMSVTIRIKYRLFLQILDLRQ